ncbi:MAG: YxeA family protein [Faecalibacterium sp.]|nr:YxeA family protein [Ruminococcus sp.]MCM1392958.1 YxeA family protein [Ruminococcus sp.]MCM1485311.1 YxeA family protein [Faecalibacterium sp.]
MNKKILACALAAIIVVIAAVGAVGWYLFSDHGITLYYTQIDNTKLEVGEGRKGVIDADGGMDYYYTLISYDKNGKEKEIRFGTSKQLKDDAFIRVSVVPLRGAVTWMEVQYNELPEAVKAHFVRG